MWHKFITCGFPTKIRKILSICAVFSGLAVVRLQCSPVCGTQGTHSVSAQTIQIWVERNDTFTESMFTTTSEEFRNVSESTREMLDPYYTQEAFCDADKPEVWLITPGRNSVIAHASISTKQNATVLITALWSIPGVILVKLAGEKCENGLTYTKLSINLTKDYTSAVTVQRANAYTIKSVASFHCFTPGVGFLEDYVWEVSENVGGEFLSLRELSTKGSLTIQPRMLRYGTHFVQMKVTVAGKPQLTGYDYGFITIEPSPLIANIKGGLTRTVTVNRKIAFNASLSWDPDLSAGPTGSYTDLDITWVCRSSNEVVDYSDVSILQQIDITDRAKYNKKDKYWRGCFLSDAGILKAKTKLVYIPSTRMHVNHAYVVSVIVRNGARIQGVYHQKIIVRVPPPCFSIRCVSNCKLNPPASQRLGLVTKCKDRCRQRGIYYRWQAYVNNGRKTPYGAIDWDFVSLNSKIMTDDTLSGPTLRLKENVLEPNKTYRIIFKVSAKHAGWEETHYEFKVNAAPYRGSCRANGSLGQGLVDKFNFSCSDWVDDDSEGPLSYRLEITRSAGRSSTNFTRLLYRGPSPNMSLILPIGKKEADYKLSLRATVIDSDEVHSYVFLEVNSFPPNLTSPYEDLLAFAGRENGSMAALVKSNQRQEAARVSTAVISVLDSNATVNMSKSDKAKIRDDIIDMTTTFEMDLECENATQEMKMTAGVLADASEMPEELTMESQEILIKAAENMTSFLGNSSSDDVVTQYDLGTTLVELAGNILGGAAQTTNGMGSSLGKNKSQAVDVTKKALNLSDSISMLLLEQKIVGEQPSLVDTKSLLIGVDRQLPGKVANNKSIVGEGGFLLPQIASFEVHNDSKDTDFIDSTLTMTSFNSYTWAEDNSASRVDSHVLSLHFNNQNKQRLEIKDLTEEIEIWIPRKPKERTSLEPNRFVTPVGNDTLVYYKFFVKYDQSTFQIEIRPNVEAMFTVFLRHGERPTVDLYDAKREVPDFTSCVEPQNCSLVQTFLNCLRLEATWDTQRMRSVCNQVPYLTINNSTINAHNSTCESLISFLYCPTTCLGSCFGKNCSFENCTGGNLTKPICLGKDFFLACNRLTEHSYKNCGKHLWPDMFYGKYQNCHKNPYRYFFSGPDFGKAGFYYLGIRYWNKLQNNAPSPTVPTNVTVQANSMTNKKSSRRRRSVELGASTNSSKPKRRCVVVNEKPPPTPEPAPPTPPPANLPVFVNETSVYFSFDVNVSSCLFWNESTEMWSTKGCRVGPNTTDGLIQCFCTHLTAFGGSTFMAPNPIDFDYVFANFTDIEDNFAVLATCIALFLLYGVLLVSARRADIADLSKITSPRILQVSGSYVYEVTVSTGMFGSSGTTANVSIVILGDRGESGVVPLINNLDGSDTLFASGSTRTFVTSVPHSLGQVHYIRIWHDNAGTKPSWYLRQVIVHDIQDNRKWYFMSRQWFAVDKCDGLIERVLYPATDDEIVGFKNIFYSKTATKLFDDHVWLSVVTKPPESTFTRVQRLTCCLTIVYSALIANAMYYQFDTSSTTDDLQFGPFSINLTELLIGVQSSILIVPINVLIIFIFRNLRPKNDSKGKGNYKMSTHSHKSHSELETDENNKLRSPLVKNLKRKKESQAKYETISELNDESPRSKKKSKFAFPNWFKYISYTLCCLIWFSSAIFLLFYSITWGEDTTNKWLSSILVSLVQDIAIIQPLKAIMVALLFSIFIQKLPEVKYVENNYQDQEFQQSAENRKNLPTNDQTKDVIIRVNNKPEKEELAEARIFGLKKRKMLGMFKETGLQLLFVACLTVVCYGNRTSDRFRLTNTLGNILKKTHKVKNADSFYKWCGSILLPALYDTTWYNGMNFTDEEGFISNREYMLVGLPRIRQARINSEPCQALKEYQSLHKFFPTCFFAYSSLNAAHESALPRPINTTDAPSQAVDPCLEPLQFKSAAELGTLPLVTANALYSGGGFVADLGYDIETAREVLTNLQYDNWIDRHTRAVFVEMMLYEPGTNMFAFVRIVFEYQPTGSMNDIRVIEPLPLYGSTNSSLDGLNIACQLMLAFLILFAIYKEGRKMIKQKKSYFKFPWNVMELFQIATTVASFTLFLLKDEKTRQIIKDVRENPYARISFDHVALLTDIENSLQAFVVFIVSMKLLRLFRFNLQIAYLSKSIKSSASALFSYGIVFTAILLAYSITGTLLFGTTEMFSSVMRAAVNQLMTILGGKLAHEEIKAIAPFVGPLFAFSYGMAMIIIMINFFVTILNDSFQDAKTSPKDEIDDTEMGEFISVYVKDSLKEVATELRKISAPSSKKECDQSKWLYSKESDLFLY